MVKTKNIIFLFVPAIAVAGFALFLSISQYEPTYLKKEIIKTEEENKNFVAIFTEDPILGNPKSPKTIIAFEDFGCGRCREQMQIFNQLLEKYPNQIKIIWKSLDVTKFPSSAELSHSYAFCANQQNKFSEFKNNLLKLEDINETSLKTSLNQISLDKNLFDNCLQSKEVLDYKEKNRQLATVLGIQTVPTIFINNKSIQEPLTLEGWQALLSLP